MFTSYDTDMAEALAGQVADTAYQDLVSYPASAALVAGRFVELASNQVRQPIDGAAGPIVGVSIYVPTNPPGGYAANVVVPCLRKGRIWVSRVSGSVLAAGSQVFVRHDNSDDSGKCDVTGANTTAIASGAIVLRTSGSELALVELNLP